LFSTLKRPHSVGCGVEDVFQMVTLSVRSKRLDADAGGEEDRVARGLRADLARLHTSAFTALCLKIRRFAPCTVCALKTALAFTGGGTMELLLTGASAGAHTRP
jgi:hypothetical protein